MQAQAQMHVWQPGATNELSLGVVRESRAVSYKGNEVKQEKVLSPDKRDCEESDKKKRTVTDQRHAHHADDTIRSAQRGPSPEQGGSGRRGIRSCLFLPRTRAHAKAGDPPKGTHSLADGPAPTSAAAAAKSRLGCQFQPCSR